MIHIFPGWLDKASFYNKLFVASASSLQARSAAQPARPRSAEANRLGIAQEGLTLAEFYVFIWLLPLFSRWWYT